MFDRSDYFSVKTKFEAVSNSIYDSSSSVALMSILPL